MKNLMNDYFYFTKRERNGMLLLIGLSLLFLVLPGIMQQFRTVEKYEFQEFKQLMAEAKIDISAERKIASKESINLSLLNPQPIDPNLADKQAFLNLGLSPKLVKTILNYRSKGGDYSTPENLRKVYGMTDSDFQRILPYLIFTPNPKQVTKKQECAGC